MRYWSWRTRCRSLVSDALDNGRLRELRRGEDDEDVQGFVGAAEPMDLAGGDVEADTGANGDDLFAQHRLARSREKGDGLFHGVGVQQDPISRLEPLLGDEEPLRAIPC